MFKLALGAFALASAVTPAIASPILDQDNFVFSGPEQDLWGSTVFSERGTYIEDSVEYERSFETFQFMTVTAGIAGTLARVDLQLAGTSNSVVVSIWDGVRSDEAAHLIGSISTTELALPSLAEVAAGSFVSFDFAAYGYHLEPGQMFSIEVAIPLPAGESFLSLKWVAGTTEPELDEWRDPVIHPNTSYTRGHGYIGQRENLGPITFFNATGDRSFKTYVDPAVAQVPEPAALGLLGLGLLGLSLVRRRRN